MRKVVGVETVSPIFGAIRNRECEILKSRFHDGLEWYKLRDLSSGAVFDSPEIFWVQSPPSCAGQLLADKLLGCQGKREIEEEGRARQGA